VISVEFVPETIYIKDVMNLLTKAQKRSGPWRIRNFRYCNNEDIVEELLEKSKMNTILMRNW
jgi:hypothetical protein